MNNERKTKYEYEVQPGGRRRGKPRKEWEQCIGQIQKVMNRIKNTQE